MRGYSVKDITMAAAVAAAYVVLSYFAGIFGLTFGPVQCRFSEALCVLPFFFPVTGWGLFIGCILTNLLSAYGVVDIVFGSLATLLAAICTSKVKNCWLAPLPPVLANAVIVGGTITWFETGFGDAFWGAFAYNILTVGTGEFIACYILGMLVLKMIPRVSFFRKMIPAGRLPVKKK